jgi:hypothetical protein
VNSTTLGSKSAAAMGAAYALLHHLGREGYRERVKKMWDATKVLLSAIDQRSDVRVIARPHMNLFALTTNGGDLFELADRLTERGWLVQPTYAFGPSPAHIHLTIDPGRRVARGRLRERPARVLDRSAACGRAACAGAADARDDRRGQETDRPRDAGGAARHHRRAAAGQGVDDPSSLDAASPAVRERLLVLFIRELFS